MVMAFWLAYFIYVCAGVMDSGSKQEFGEQFDFQSGFVTLTFALGKVLLHFSSPMG